MLRSFKQGLKRLVLGFLFFIFVPNVTGSVENERSFKMQLALMTPTGIVYLNMI